MGPVVIRRAVKEDGPILLALIKALAEYERLDPPDHAAQARLLADISSKPPRFDALLAFANGKAVGYAISLKPTRPFSQDRHCTLRISLFFPNNGGKGSGLPCSARLLRRRNAAAAAGWIGRCSTGTKPLSDSMKRSALHN
jgi:hypothetical protein